MGRQKVEAVSGGVPLQGHHGPYGSEIAEYHRKSFRQDSTVRVGAATVRFRNLEQNIVADALSRQPLQGTSRRVSVEDDEQSREQQGCRWKEEMRRKVKQQPQKFPDYLEEDGKDGQAVPTHSASGGQQGCGVSFWLTRRR